MNIIIKHHLYRYKTCSGTGLGDGQGLDGGSGMDIGGEVGLVTGFIGGSLLVDDVRG